MTASGSSTRWLIADEFFEFGGAFLFSQRQRRFPHALVINNALTRRLGFHGAVSEFLAVEFHPHVVSPQKQERMIFRVFCDAAKLGQMPAPEFVNQRCFFDVV